MLCHCFAVSKTAVGQDCCAGVGGYWLVNVNINSFATDVERKRLGTYFEKRLSCENLAVNEHKKYCCKPNFSFLHIDYSLPAGPCNLLQLPPGSE
jgi:hypothetical protein